MTGKPLQIDTSSKPPKPKRCGWGFWILAFLTLFLLVNVIGVGWRAIIEYYLPANEPAANFSLQTESGESIASPDNESTGNSKLQWTSPTSGQPINLYYVPMGTQAVLNLRPAYLVHHSEGEKVLAALGPWGAEVIQWIEQATGAKLSEIETLLVALHREEGEWQFTLRVDLEKPWTSETLAQRTAHVRKDRVVFLPETSQGLVLVSCPQTVHEDLLDYGDLTAELPRDLERLLPFTDVQRIVSILMPARFLATEGRELFLDGGEKLISAFQSLVPDNAGALALSATFDRKFVGNEWQGLLFCELAATIIQDAPPHRFANQFAEQLKSAEQRLADDLDWHPPHLYGKAVAERFPAMLRAMSDYTRTSHQDGIAIARCYLPGKAAHNLLLASRLSLESRGSDRLSADEVVAVRPLSIAERLNQVTSLSFPKETLEKALEMLSTDARVPIQIAGRDLQLEGITKNQTFSLDRRNRPVHEILLEVLRQANPDREATGPADTRQKLIYVIRGNEILVTTRQAATERGEKLPEVFGADLP